MELKLIVNGAFTELGTDPLSLVSLIISSSTVKVKLKLQNENQPPSLLNNGDNYEEVLYTVAPLPPFSILQDYRRSKTFEDFFMEKMNKLSHH